MTDFFAVDPDHLSRAPELSDDHPLCARLHDWRALATRLDYARLFASIMSESRIAERVLAMLENGWLVEVQVLMDRGFGAWLTASQAIGYAELAEHLDGRLSLDEAAERTVKRTRELASRQMAWFRRDPRIRWFDAGAGGAPEVADDIRAYLGST